MLFFKKKTQTLGESGFFRGFVDFHSHILPGVDDGFRKVEDSLTALSRYEELGVNEVWLTPHIMEDIPNTTEDLKARFEEFRLLYKGPIKLHLSAEYMMDQCLLERLENDDLLYHDDEKTTLMVETSIAFAPVGFDSTIDKILSKGIFPILAHPERYLYLAPEDYSGLKSKGVRFQMNVPSMAGIYGPAVQDRAKILLQKGYYNFYGNDLHSNHMLDMILDGKHFTI